MPDGYLCISRPKRDPGGPVIDWGLGRKRVRHLNSIVMRFASGQRQHWCVNDARTPLEEQGPIHSFARETDASTTSAGQLSSVSCQDLSGLYSSMSLKIFSVSGPRSF